MKRALQVAAFFALAVLAGCAGRGQQADDMAKRISQLQAEDRWQVLSPGGVNLITVSLRDGIPYYEVIRNGEQIVKPSRLGLQFSDFSLTSGFRVVADERNTVDERWEQPWGEQRRVRDHHNSLSLTLRQDDNDAPALILHLRAYDDGVAFRYEVQPLTENTPSFELMEELTEFALAGDGRAWSIPGFEGNRYEFLYRETAISELDTVHTPVTMHLEEGPYLSIHEAALTDYASMVLRKSSGTTLKCRLVEWSDGVKVRGELPLVSPWRTIVLGDTPGELIESTLILNCNEPNVLDDVAWIKPGKYVGIWWELHLDISTWSSGPRHGATTENTKRYIDFAAKHGFDGVLVEGWNIGWDGDWTANADSFSFTESYPDYDLRELARYANERGVYLIAHNETSTGIWNYERQLEDAFKLYHDLGIRAVKTGYVGHGKNIKRYDPETGKVLGLEWHHGQWMVNHYRKVVELAAKYQLMLDVHEPVKATGIRRTWPNMMTREGARGMEYNAWWQGGNPPEHETMLPFTRMLGGPFDFTPGIFDILLTKDARPNNRVNTTLAKQLALYVVLYSPLHMAADLPQNYEGHPAFKFIEDVPVDWEQTKVLNGEIGEYVTYARKDRNSDDWYIGAVTDENGRTYSVVLDFLDAGRTYQAQIYRDADDADWVTNPLAYKIESKPVMKDDTLDIKLAPGGGIAVRFQSVTE